MQKILVLAVIGLLLSGIFNVVAEKSSIGITETTNNGPFELLIIAADDLEDRLGSFVEYKNNIRNITTKLVTTTEIYKGSNNYFPPNGRDDAEKIKNFIYNAALDSTEGGWEVKYVLLVGNYKKVPTRNVYVAGWVDDYPILPSDLYYADIFQEDSEGNRIFASWNADNDDVIGEEGEDDAAVDLYPDVFIGRLPCSNDDEVDDTIAKIKRYESNNCWDNEKILVCGGDAVPADIYGLNEGEYINQKVIDKMPGIASVKSWESLDTLTKYKIEQNLDAGVNFVDFSGHGSQTNWFTYAHKDSDTKLPGGGINVDDVENFQNTQLPIVVISACLCGKFTHYLDDCLAWAFVKNPNGGAIASFAFSGTVPMIDPSTTYYGEGLCDRWLGWMEVELFHILYNNKILGDVWASILTNYLNTFSNSPDGLSDKDYRIVKELILFGDPTLNKIGDSGGDNEPPNLPTITGPTSVKVGEKYNYSLTCTDPNDDDIVFYIDWDDGLVDTSVGPAVSGETIEKNHSWNFKGTKQIKVQAIDEKGAESEWASLEITVSKKTRNMPHLIFRIIKLLIKTFKYPSSINNC